MQESRVKIFLNKVILHKLINIFMKKPLFILIFAIPLFCVAQNPLSRNYEYDAAGNRVVRSLIVLPHLTPTAPDSIRNNELGIRNDDTHTVYRTPHTAEYFVEHLDQVEIKIYPNPTTEKVTLEISNMEKLQIGNFKLYSLTGQLLQEHHVYSTATTVSLSGLPYGAYILKVQINDRIEDWKIIKN